MNKDVCKPSRERYWAELDDTGKIERLHEVVKMLQRDVARVIAENTKLRQHSHATYGGILIPLNSHDDPGEERAFRRNDEWF